LAMRNIESDGTELTISSFFNSSDKIELNDFSKAFLSDGTVYSADLEVDGKEVPVCVKVASLVDGNVTVAIRIGVITLACGVLDYSPKCKIDQQSFDAVFLFQAPGESSLLFRNISIAFIFFIVLCCFIGCALICGIIYFIRKRKSKSKARLEEQESYAQVE